VVRNICISKFIILIEISNMLLSNFRLSVCESTVGNNFNSEFLSECIASCNKGSSLFHKNINVQDL
jgi:hypothetical protein